MSNEAFVVAPVVQHTVEQPILDFADHASIQHATPTAEQIQAADQLFVKQEREHQFVAGLLGMYTGTLLLRDLAAEHLSHEDEEDTLDESPGGEPGANE